MLSYMLSSGFNHLASVSPRSTVVLEALQSLGADIRHYPSHWDRLCELREEVLGACYPPWPTSRHDFVPYILIAYSSPQLLELFLSSSRPLKPRAGTNPLVYAADLGKMEHAMALLASGVDANQRGLVVDDSHHASPLEVAIDLGEDVLVGELLQRDCSVTWKLLSTAVCMPWCSTQVLVKLMETDEFVEWACEIGDEELYRGVFSSARPNPGDILKSDEDHVALARRLRQIGQDLSADSRFGAELIERAVHAAHKSTLELLLPQDQPPPSRFLLAAATGDTPETVSLVHFFLQKGVDVHAVTEGGEDSALHLAARCPWEPRSLELIQMLIVAGCSPHARNMRGETPWTIAATHEYSSVVELLLSCDVPLPPYSLHVALEQRLNPQMIRSLMLRGADVHAVSEFTGSTVLHHAVVGSEVDEDEEDEHQEYEESDCLDLVKCFIEAGCNLATCNSEGETVFEVAFQCGYTSVIKLLLSHSTPLPSNIIHLALERGHSPQMIQLLILRGANVHAVSEFTGNTVLHHVVVGREVYEDGEDDEYRGYKESERLDLVKCFVAAGCNLTICNSEGETVFEAAFQRGYTSVIKLLLTHSTPLPSNIIHLALERGHSPQMIQSLILRGANVHAVSEFTGNTVLHHVIGCEVYEDDEDDEYWGYNKSERLDLVKCFVAAGCNLATCNSEGETVFEAAFQRGYTSVIELLLSHNTPLPSNIIHLALERGHSPQIIQSLIISGANVHAISELTGNTVLHHAVVGREADGGEEDNVFEEYKELECLDLVKCFTEAGCNLATRNSEGKTAFEIAFSRGCIPVVEFLLSHNAPLPPDILSIALQRCSSLQMIQCLVRNGADVHFAMSGGDTVLHLAISGYSEVTCWELAKTFIEAGCSLVTCNSAGKTGFDIAFECDYTSVMELLLSHNFPPPSDILLIALQRCSSLSTVQLLIRRGADLHCTTPNDDTILHLAITEYYFAGACRDLVKSFIDAGCNPAAYNSDGKTVLEAAIQHGHISVVELLLSYNVPFRPDILPIVLWQGPSPQMVQLLIQRGADVHSTTSDGNTVLHLAITEYYCEGTCWELVKTFLEVGCNPTACNFDGKPILEAAIQRGYTLVVELLLQYNVPLLPDTLLIALRWHCAPEMVQLLVSKGTDNHTAERGLDWDTLVQLAHSSYSGRDRRQVLEILNTSREAKNMYLSLEDETPIRAAKRPRLA